VNRGVLLYQESTDDSFWQVLRGSITNALIILGAVLISTCVFIALFYYNCMKVRKVTVVGVSRGKNV